MFNRRERGVRLVFDEPRNPIWPWLVAIMLAILLGITLTILALVSYNNFFGDPLPGDVTPPSVARQANLQEIEALISYCNTSSNWMGDVYQYDGSRLDELQRDPWGRWQEEIAELRAERLHLEQLMPEAQRIKAQAEALRASRQNPLRNSGQELDEHFAAAQELHRNLPQVIVGGAVPPPEPARRAPRVIPIPPVRY